MKKKIFGGIAVLAFAAIVGLNVKMNADKNQISDLALANIEALAGEAGGTTHGLSCGKSGIKLCKGKCGIHQIELEAWGSGSPVSLTCPN